jgi:hypothetical protein
MLLPPAWMERYLGENMLPMPLAVSTYRSRLLTRLLPAALAFGLCVFFAGSTAALVIDVSGVVGSGTTTWNFSGTTGAWAVGPDQDGDFALGTNELWGRLNNFQWPDFDSGPFGTFSEINIVLSNGASVTGSNSGAHLIEGFTFESFPRFAWFADGAFDGGLETMTFSGLATAAFEISLLDGIDGIGDLTTVTANDNVLGNLTMNFTAVPEPSTALLMGLGLAGLGVRRRLSL